MRRKWLKELGVLVGASSIFAAASWSFFTNIVGGKRMNSSTNSIAGHPKKNRWELNQKKINHPRYRFEKEYEGGKQWCREQQMEECRIQSEDGLTLYGQYLPAWNAERTILLCHGYKGSAFGDFAYNARFLHEHQCNLLFIEQRCCGKSEGEYVTFGAMEQRDVACWAEFLAKRNKERLPIYLFGKSMGAASVLMAAGHPLPQEVRGIISDCGFSNMRGQIKDMAANWFHLHWIHLLLFQVDMFCGVFGKFRMKDADTETAMKQNHLPVLFFHGALDTFVDPKNSIINYSMCRAKKELVIIPEARHLCCVYEQPQLYQNKLLDFFLSCEIGESI